MPRDSRAARAGGVLLHVSSLPDGRIGPSAYAFVDWLEEAGQSWWQLLPLGPRDAVGSPFNSSSAFAAGSEFLGEPAAPVSGAEVAAFCAAHSYWACDWERFAGRSALEDQVRFEREWRALRAYARGRGVALIGDLPFSLASGGAEARSHPELFLGGLRAGAPPDPLAPGGQLWGSLLHDWPAIRRRGYRFFVERIRRGLELADWLRVDHFRGYVAAWAVPEAAPDASYGRWRRGPGGAPFRAVSASIGSLPLIAEDLGVITKPVERLRESLGLPGSAVLQFGFAGGPRNPHRPGAIDENMVVYTGTHDLDTTLGWWRGLSQAERVRTGLDPTQPHWSLIELAYASRARLAIIPAQDLLGLGSEARMNVPGTTEGNWRWRLEAGALTSALASRLRALSAATGRLPARAAVGRAQPPSRRPRPS